VRAIDLFGSSGVGGGQGRHNFDWLVTVCVLLL
jgi:hypothetical protein